jgi:hypothetical protein
MFSRSILRQAARVAAPARPLAVSARNMSVTPSMREQDKPIPEEKGEHVGSFSRTDNSIEIPFDEKTVPSQEPVQGRGGFHFQRTLASFTLEGKTALVTGGARGLGLVMAQALVVSGADVALVDLNSASHRVQVWIRPKLTPSLQRRKPRSKQRNWSRSSRMKTLAPTEYQRSLATTVMVSFASRE